MNKPLHITAQHTLSFTAQAMGIFFIRDQLLLSVEHNAFKLPCAVTVQRLMLRVQDRHLDAGLHVIGCETGLTNDALLQRGYRICTVKEALSHVAADDCEQLLKHYHWLNWNRQSRYCGACGSPLKSHIHATEKQCLSCKRSLFPRFSPAVMVLIHRDDQILLARSPHFPPGDYSAIAGFIEVGETAEQAAHREVREELGMAIDDLTYFSTQTWPFPDSFMIAFTARYAGGELRIDPDELEDARWFHIHNLPQLPHRASIARQLIRHVACEGGTRDPS